jgi:excinuclease UvrABC helicase subunit UvrB
VIAEQLIPRRASSLRWSCADPQRSLDEIRHRERSESVIVTTLTKKMAEDLTDYLFGRGAGALPALEIDTLDRIAIIELRLGEIRRSSA